MATIKTTIIKHSQLSSNERALRAETSRLASMANKRLKRLEEQNLVDTPAYKKWIDDGGQKFGVRGKTMDEVKAETARLNNFLQKTTSTVRGAKKNMENIAHEIGVVKWENYKDLQNKLNTFFDVTSKVKEYLYNTKEIGVAIGYQAIWDIVGNYVSEMETGMTDTENDVIELAKKAMESTTLSEADRILDDFLLKFE